MIPQSHKRMGRDGDNIYPYKWVWLFTGDPCTWVAVYDKKHPWKWVGVSGCWPQAPVKS